jgi:diguanylate cyclase (GGDEF)-like protein/PAS domain S-box-containing protein
MKMIPDNSTSETLLAANAALETTLARFTDFFDSAPVGFFTLTRDGVIVETNLAGASLLGMDRSKIAGKDFIRFIVSEKRQAFTNFLSRIFDGGGRQVCETILQKNMGVPALIVQVTANARKSGQECQLFVNDVTERSRMDQALREKDYLLSESQRMAHVGSWSMVINSDYVRCSDEIYRIYGISPESFSPTLKNWIGLTYANDQPAFEEWMHACIAGKQQGELEYRIVRPDKTMRVLQGRCALQYDEAGVPLRLIGAVQDITENKRIENELHKSEALFRMIAENVNDLIAMLDTQGRRIYFSPSYLRIFGDDEFKIGSVSFNKIHPEDRERIKALFRKTVETGVGDRAEFRLLLSDGSVRYIESEGNVVLDEFGKVAKVILVSRDVTRRKQEEEQMLRVANYDVLTDLPNRRLLTDRLQQALASAKRDKTRLAVLFLDLDMFKRINDTLGHEIGDSVLREMAKRLSDCLRESDSAARIGGDEFVTILPGIESERHAMLVAEKIRNALAQPVEIAGHTPQISTSIGIAIYPENGNDDKELLKNADDAMYFAKTCGRNVVKLYSERMVA